ncbi:MAG: putative flap endonuclease-1-like 5' DNA nuclease [Pseudohongiellaceae bacterium]
MSKETKEKKLQKGKALKTKAKNKKELKGVKARLKLAKKDLKNQVDALTNDVKSIGEKSLPSSKMIQKLEKKYKKKFLKLQHKFDTKLSSLQDKVVAQLPNEITEKLHLKTKSEEKISRKPATNVGEKVKKVTPKSNILTIEAIKGVGPVLQKKLDDAGVKTIDDLANPSDAQLVALKQFEKTRGFETWQDQAKELLNK